MRSNTTDSQMLHRCKIDVSERKIGHQVKRLRVGTKSTAALASLGPELNLTPGGQQTLAKFHVKKGGKATTQLQKC